MRETQQEQPSTSDTTPEISKESFHAERKRLDTDIKSSAKKIYSLSNQIKALEKKTSLSNNDQEKLKASQSQLSSAENTLRDNLAELRSKTQTLSAKIKELEEEDNNLKLKIEEIKTQKNELKNQNKNSDEYKNAKTILKNLTEQHNQATKKIKELKDEEQKTQSTLRDPVDRNQNEPESQASNSNSFSEVEESKIQSLSSSENDKDDSTSQSSHETQGVIEPRALQQNNTIPNNGEDSERIELSPPNFEHSSTIAIVTNACGGEDTFPIVFPNNLPQNQDGDQGNAHQNEPPKNQDGEEETTTPPQVDSTTTNTNMPTWQKVMLMAGIPGAGLFGAGVYVKKLYDNAKTSDEQSANSDVNEEPTRPDETPVHLGSIYSIPTNKKTNEVHLEQELSNTDALTASNSMPVEVPNEVHLKPPVHIDETFTSTESPTKTEAPAEAPNEVPLIGSSDQLIASGNPPPEPTI